jgi:SpoVK/Ycf46/Vps4 family AAA+-type ATPase
MENNLRQWFEMAASWDAIILIDEADVFLEKRSVNDLQRNSLISGNCSLLLYSSLGLYRTASINTFSFPPLYGIFHRDAFFGMERLLPM